VSAGFRASIQAALHHERDALDYALQFGRGLDVEQGRRFVHMYVNDLTLEMGEIGQRALARLYERAVVVGAIARAPVIDLV